MAHGFGFIVAFALGFFLLDLDPKASSLASLFAIVRMEGNGSIESH